MKKLKLFTIGFIVIVLAACDKQGATGPTGPQGATGAQGPSGSNGVANISSGFYIAYTSSWAVLSSNVFYIYGSDPNITDYNNDAVLVYFQTASGNPWISMPVSSYFYTNDELYYTYTNSTVYIYYGNSATSTVPPTTLYFKVLVIPPAAMIKHPGVNWKNSSEVEQIPEVQEALNSK